MMIIDLIQNIALLLALSAIYGLLVKVRREDRRVKNNILCGVLFGGVAIIGMKLPFQYAPGVIFDGRPIVLAMAGLFGGWLPASIASALASGYRASLGGPGALTGIGVIFTSAAIGVLFHQRLKGRVYALRPTTLYV
ncbi:MAG: hypothetical protein JRJ29_06030, partial [Deltaproteobacteria bacterium]|nr:hypothetical protein [Deltaproteobacteria bacterium]